MYVFGSKRSRSGSKRPGGAPMPHRSSDTIPSASGPAAGRSAGPLAGQRFEAALLVAGLPAAARETCIRQVLALAAKRPTWQEEDVGDAAAEQCRCWWPLAEARLHQQTPLWLLNRIVRRVWLLHQGQRVGQVYGELERQLGDAALALEWVSRMIDNLSRVGIL